MKINTIKVDKSDSRTIQRGFVRVSLKGIGCGATGCHCSPDNFITISDGETMLSVTLTAEEAKLLLEGYATIMQDTPNLLKVG